MLGLLPVRQPASCTWAGAALCRSRTCSPAHPSPHGLLHSSVLPAQPVAIWIHGSWSWDTQGSRAGSHGNAVRREAEHPVYTWIHRKGLASGCSTPPPSLKTGIIPLYLTWMSRTDYVNCQIMLALHSGVPVDVVWNEQNCDWFLEGCSPKLLSRAGGPNPSPHLG